MRLPRLPLRRSPGPIACKLTGMLFAVAMLAVAPLPVTSAFAADPQTPIPAKAAEGWLAITVFPQARLDGEPARFAPGARIVDATTRLTVTPSSIRSRVRVRYLRDRQGLLSTAWILRNEDTEPYRSPQ
ncbi:MAG: hypothetical protein H6934_10710 [Burkholderiaceae bacterium]|nr:hypothetical protein [Burkholderiaceae bacterium]